MKKTNKKFASKDFSLTQLPQTRKEQFFFIIKNQTWVLFLLGIILLGCLAPIILTIFLKNQLANGLYEEYLQGVLTKEEFDSDYLYLVLYSSGFETIFCLLLAVAVSGANRILKLLVNGEGVIFKDDFKLGIKENYLNTSLLLVFTGVILTICRFVSIFFLQQLFGIPLYILLVSLVLPVFLLASIFSSYYEGNIFQCISNSLKLYIAYWWKYLIGSISLVLVIYLVSLLGTSPPIMAFVYIFLCIIALPVYMLALFELSTSLFDKYINKDYFASNYLLGLYNPNKEDMEVNLEFLSNSVDSENQVSFPYYYDGIDKENADLRLFFVGNSITIHEKKEEIGWLKNCGMAASDINHDYVHLIYNNLVKKGKKVSLNVVNAASWERDFTNKEKLSIVIDAAKDFKPDIAIIRIGENFNKDYLKNGIDPFEGFDLLLGEMSKYSKRIILTSMFWRNELIDNAIIKVSTKYNAEYVKIYDLGDDRSNLAYEQYKNNAIYCGHPGDIGMKRIAQRILKKININ